MIRSVMCMTRQQLKGLMRGGFVLLLLFGAGISIYHMLGNILLIPVNEYAPLIDQMKSGVEVLLLVFLLGGVLLTRTAQSVKADEFYASFPRGRYAQAISRMMTVVILAFGVSFVMMLACGVTSFAMGAHGDWLWVLLRSYTLHFFLPFTACGFLGLLLAEKLPGKGIYSVILAFWFLSSSQAYRLYEYVSVALGGHTSIDSTEVFRVGGIFNMGIPGGSIYPLLNNMTVLPYDLGWCCYRLFWVLTPMVLLVVNAFVQGRTAARETRWLRLVVPFTGLVCAAALCVIFLLFSSRMMYTQGHVAGGQWENRYSDYQQKYRHVLSGDMTYLWDDHMTVLKEDIDLSVGVMGLSAEVTMTLRADAPLTGQIFTLYQDFAVHSVEVNGQSVPCEQEREALWIPFDDPLEQGDEVEVVICYSGYGPASFPTDETTTQLYHRFAWLPWPGVYERADSNSSAYMLLPYEQMDDPVLFTLKIDDDEHIYCSLPQREVGVYSGVSDRGVLLYNNLYKTQTESGNTLYLPLGAWNTRTGALDRYDRLLEYEAMVASSKADIFGWLTGETPQTVAHADTLVLFSEVFDCIWENGTSTALSESTLLYRYKDFYMDYILELVGMLMQDFDPYKQSTYQELLNQSLKPLASQAFIYPVIGEYCQYRDGVTSVMEFEENLTKLCKRTLAALGMESSDSEIGALADALIDTPRETVDALFISWYQMAQRGENVEFTTLDDITEAISGVRPVHDEAEEPTAGVRPESTY